MANHITFISNNGLSLDGKILWQRDLSGQETIYLVECQDRLCFVISIKDDKDRLTTFQVNTNNHSIDLLNNNWN